jgi:hypothetical protein
LNSIDNKTPFEKNENLIQNTFSTNVERMSGYFSTSWSNRGNLCLASIESSFIAFSKQTVMVSGKFF